MIEKKLCKTSAFVDEKATRRLYASLPAIQSDNSACANFLANLHLRRAALHAYFKPLGIDVTKCVGLWPLEVDAYKQSICYSGAYPFIGEIPHMDKMGDPEDISSAWFDFEETDFGFELCLFHDGPQLKIKFWVDFPWLFEPPVTIGRYTDKTKLPEQWASLSPSAQRAIAHGQNEIR